ncbi:MAG: ATP-binding protein, partial [Anaerolineae bacterium]|nr:ATP-binding protein [Anaerolineae bacterium]
DVVITLQDQGQAFDPDRVAAPHTSQPLSRRPVGGLGLHLMRKLMDEVRFAFAPGHNTLVMIKRNAVLQPAASAGEEADA